MRLQKTHWLAIFITAIFMWLGQIYHVTPNARPDTLGELLFLLTLLLPLINKFNTSSLILSAILGVLSYQTKIYFFMGVIIMASYLFFFVSKRKALFYTIIAIVLFSISFLFLNYYFEAYFINTLNVSYNAFSMNYTKLLEQCIKLIRDYWGLFLIGLGVVLNTIIGKRVRDFTKIKFDITNFDSPLLSFSMDLLLYCLIFTLLFVVFVLNNGTHQIYYYNLITPFLVMKALIYIDKQDINRNWFMFLAIFTLITQTYENLKPYFLPFDSNDWQKLEARISRAEAVLNSPVDVSILIDQGKPVALSGSTQSFFYKPPTSALFIFPDIKEYYKQGQYYLEQIAAKVKNKEYDFLETIENENYETFHFANRFDPNQSNIDFISDYYHKVDTLTIPMPTTFQEWKIGIWEPN